jgi:hypothetical protein
VSERDSVGLFLAGRGCPEHVVRGGLDGLLHHWESVVEDVEEIYPLGLDDYLNDMDARQLLEEALAVAAPGERARISARLDAADERMQELLVDAGGCLWGEARARENGWTPAGNWWYFRRPATPGPDLEEGLGL